MIKSEAINTVRSILGDGGCLMGRKERKAQQRQAYKAAFKKVKHGHGGRAIRKKEEAALGR